MEGDSRNPAFTLLRKYDIPIEHLSYEYVEGCKNKKELEKILRILESGEEGVYPDLIKFTQDHLKKIAPDSKVLRIEEPAITKDSISKEEWKEMEKDLLFWEKEMKVMDRALDFEKGRTNIIHNKNFSEIRKVSSLQMKETKSYEGKKIKIETNKKNERIKSGDYASWEKFDVDKELLKIDVEEERNAEEMNKVKKQISKRLQQQKKIEVTKSEIDKDCYSTLEQEVLANQAKDRGNECFKSGDYSNALKYYDISITFHPTVNAYNNRAMTYIKLKKYKESLQDCDEVLKFEPENVKALHRRSISYRNIPSDLNNKLAFQDLSKIISLEPNNKAAQSDLTTLRKELKIEESGRKFRMPIQETHGLQKYVQLEKADKKQNSCNKSEFNIGLELPLTYYGPSTSVFQCEPQSVAHRMLSGPSSTGKIVCRCNSSTLRQNPLCQKCGEEMCRPKSVKKSLAIPKVETQKIFTKNKNVNNSYSKNSIASKYNLNENEKTTVKSAIEYNSKIKEAVIPQLEESKWKVRLNNLSDQSNKTYSINYENVNRLEQELLPTVISEKLKSEVNDNINFNFDTRNKVIKTTTLTSMHT